MPDPVFRGMTKSALWWGVPVKVAIMAHMPLILVTLYAVAIFGWQSIMIAIFIPMNHFVMREITRSHPHIWRQIGLFATFRLIHRDRSYKFWHSSTYGPR